MVGVPRSKGCARCRQRRKGCDKQRPSCGQCLAAGATCHGYERERVFLNTFTGSDRDAGLTTARYSKATAPVVAAAAAAAAHGSSDSIFSGPWARAWAQRLDPDEAARSGSTPPALIASAGTVQLGGRFLQDYLPGGRPDWMLDSWLEVVPTMKTADRLAHDAFKAIALCTAGRTTGNEALMRHGLDMYGVGMHRTTNAVQDARLARSTAVLAAVKVFGMIELLYGEERKDLCIPARSWVYHVDGQVAVTLLQRPEAFQTGIEHRLFVGSRYSQLVSCIQYQRRYPLNTPEWRTIPWEVIPKTNKDHMVDILADMVDLFVDINEWMAYPSNPSSELYRLKLLQKAYRLQDQCQQWLQTWGPLKIFVDNNGDLVPYKDQRDFALADLTLFHWSTRLFLCMLIRRLHPDSTPVPPGALPSAWIQKMTQAIPWFFNRATGIMGGHRVQFPLGVLLVLTQEANDATPEDLEAIYAILFDPFVQSHLGKFLSGVKFETKNA